MYEYIQGKLSHATPGESVVDLQGMGYYILTPINSFPKLPPFGEEVFFYLSLIIRENMHTLFGFLTKMEREIFNRLIHVSGIGPKTALSLLGHIEASDLQLAISQGNLALLCKVPGIGKKTAERLIVDMRDSIQENPFLSKGENDLSQDALNALIHLGYNPLHAQKAVKTALQNREGLDLSQLITESLRVFNGGSKS